MMQFNSENLVSQLNKYVIKDEDKNFVYGTAGFRADGSRLYGIAFRIGIFAVIRSMKEKGAVMGVMVTASHNKATDNGLKVIDKGGEMLKESWEEYAVQLIKIHSTEVVDFIKRVVKEENIDTTIQGSVFIGRDNRATSDCISTNVCEGIKALGGMYTDFGLVTTPQLHYCVLKQNENLNIKIKDLESYYNQICGSYSRLMTLNSVERVHLNPLYLDCANGVGAVQLKSVIKRLSPWLDHVKLCNTLTKEQNVMNKNCGADFIKSKYQFPVIHNGPVNEISVGQRWASIDGDADRFLYFFRADDEKLRILDGDKQSVVICDYLKKELENVLGSDWNSAERNNGQEIKFGVVNTAYANQACTTMLTEKIGVPVVCVPTGVKYLHHVGHEIDIRLYFETNGHGSILMSERAKSELSQLLPIGHPLRLILIDGIINQAVGDSLSQLLLLEYLYYIHQTQIITNTADYCATFLYWYSLYDNLPCRQTQVAIKDRRLIRTTDMERKVCQPVKLQSAIDELLSDIQQKGTRVFVRPSGTEDVVRVYCEAQTQAKADDVANAVAKLVYRMVCGVGPEP